ncbi:hypothetical protein [Roseitranquillus sediminis]|uniref:hypothetical protein n=1 Tax=Roseitranquillus sediminis TaxID=2809051 RepID=UPI001D0BF738|nr:hypothetical protein [Roseitranquillus sediminis]MBM9594484.1 hypothetical protein [Roseitranquillus sediminis]
MAALADPPADDGSADLRPLIRQLRASHRRLLALRVAQGALAAPLAGASLLIAGRELERAGLPPGMPPLALAGTAAAVALAGAVFWALAGTLPFGRFVSRADARLGTQERLSTALEVERDRGSVTPVAAALIADAAARAPVAQPRRLVPVSPGWAVAWLVATGLLVLALAVPTPYVEAPPAPSQLAADEASLLPAAREAAVEDVQRVAEFVRAEAVRREDPYLGAVGRELDTLLERLQGGTPISAAALNRELRRLGSHAEAGLRRAGAAPEELAQAAMTFAAAAEAADEPTAPAPAAADPLPPADEAVRESIAESNGDGPVSASSSVATASQPSAAPAGGEGEAATFNDGECVHDGDLDCFIITEGTDAPSVILERQDDQKGGNLPGQGGASTLQNAFRLGASGRSNSGESTEAGTGSAAIGGGTTPDAGAYAQGSEVTLAPGELSGEGSRIRIDAAPDATRTIEEGGSAGPSSAWRRQEESEVARPVLDAAQARAVARYFTGDQEPIP